MCSRAGLRRAKVGRARFALPRIALLFQRQYGVRQVEKQRSAEKAKHAAQRQIKALTGACNLIVAINVLRGLNKAPAGDHNNSDTEQVKALASATFSQLFRRLLPSDDGALSSPRIFPLEPPQLAPDAVSLVL